MACCPLRIKSGRLQAYATTTGTGVQYYRVYTKICCLLNKPHVLLDIVSTGATAADTASLIADNGSVIPLVKASDLTDVTVGNLLAGTSIDIVVKL
jgi:hypothetical protein